MKTLRFLAVILICICTALFAPEVAAAPSVKSKSLRSVVPLSRDWKFLKDPANQKAVPKPGLPWQVVHLPHTWNDKDVEDNIPGYYRGASSEMTTVLPYNLLARYKKPTTEERVFNIYLDKVKIASELNLPKRFGPAVAVSKKTVAIVRNDRGIRQKFEALAGRPALNALEVTRLE